jgi:Fe2+ or Zn2+ uptake regulation protein
VYYETFTKQHFHFINEETGQIIDISPEDIQISENLLKKIKNINNINIFGNLK